MNSKKFAFFLLFFLLIFVNSIKVYDPEINFIDDSKNNGKIENLKSAGYWTLTPIFVNGESQWSTLVLNDWCSGSGTWSDPYLLENITINANGGIFCIYVYNSQNVYFRINNCTLYNSGDVSLHSGILLSATNNGTMTNNEIYLNQMGILTLVCENNTIDNNTVHSNYQFEIVIYQDSHNNTISNNFVYNATTGILIAESSNNTVIGNNITDVIATGIQNVNANNTNIESNFVSYSNDGIGIVNSTDCIIFNNTVRDNIGNGLALLEHTNRTLIYYNYFINNSINAVDNSTVGNSNQWDNGTIGNYYDDYTGRDKDDNGIGDTPYEISGTAGSIDHYPIWSDGIEEEKEEKEEVIYDISFYQWLGIFGVISLFVVYQIKRHGLDIKQKSKKR